MDALLHQTRRVEWFIEPPARAERAHGRVDSTPHGETVMQSTYVVLTLLAVTAAGLSGALVGWVGAITVALFGRWEVARRVALLAHLGGGRHAAS